MTKEPRAHGTYIRVLEGADVRVLLSNVVEKTEELGLTTLLYPYSNQGRQTSDLSLRYLHALCVIQALFAIQSPLRFSGSATSRANMSASWIIIRWISHYLFPLKPCCLLYIVLIIRRCLFKFDTMTKDEPINHPQVIHL